jgi:hypothetical protein
MDTDTTTDTRDGTDAAAHLPTEPREQDERATDNHHELDASWAAWTMRGAL